MNIPMINELKQSNNRSRRLPYPGINARIIAPFMLVILAIAAIGVFVVTQLVAGSIQERFNNQLVDSAQAASNTIVDIERQNLATLRLLVFTDGVPQAVREGNISDLYDWFLPITANADVDDVIIFDANGATMLQLRRVSGIQYDSTGRPDISDWDSVQNIIDENTDDLGDKYFDIIGEAPNQMLYLSSPVTDSDTGEVVGGVTLGIDIKRLTAMVREQSLSAVTFFDDNGAVLGTTFRDSAIPQLSLEGNQTEDIYAQLEGGSPINELEVDDGQYQMLYAPLKVRSQQVGLLGVALRTNFIVERTSTSRNVFGIVFSVLFISIWILGVFVSRSITRPISKLVNTTRAIRDGDLSRRVELKTPDELGELGISSDHMTNQLVQRNQEINELYLQQLQETTQRDAVLASISDALIVQDLSGKIILNNVAAHYLIDSTSRDEKLRNEFRMLLQQVKQTIEPTTVQFMTDYYSVLATPVQMQGEGTIGYVIVFRNITPIVRAEHLKDELILQMSHELRTPLTSARGYVDLIKMMEAQQLSGQGSKFLENAIDNLKTLERMVTQVIEVSAIISDQLNLAIEPINVGKLLTEKVEEWHPIAANRGLILSLFPVNNLWISGDYERLGQVLDHVLQNSYNYTLPGGFIEVSAEHHAERISITVFDSGVGIDSDDIENVFERMYRGKSADAGPTDSRGLGLGLYMTKQIIEAHRGSISLESKAGAGTMVTIELPALKQPSAVATQEAAL